MRWVAEMRARSRAWLKPAAAVAALLAGLAIWLLFVRPAPVESAADGTARVQQPGLPVRSVSEAHPHAPAQPPPPSRSSPSTLHSTAALNVRYPQGLAPLVGDAIQRQDGRLAMELAQALSRCERVLRMQSQLRESMQNEAAPPNRQILHNAHEALQREQATCQAVGGDGASLRRQLLQTAAKAGESGASFELFLLGESGQPVMQQLVLDGERGDRQSLRIVASGLAAAATPLQIAAAKDAFVRGAGMSDLPQGLRDELISDLDFLNRQGLAEALKVDSPQAGKLAAARQAWTQEQVGMTLVPSMDPQVRALADQYLAALKRRQKAQQGGG